MSCDARVVVTGDRQAADDATRHAIARLHELERRWSRFLPTSEISLLNAAGGRPCRVSPDTTRLVTALVQAWHATSGRFDPTLLGTLVELGYAASRDDATVHTSLAPDVASRGHPDRILVDAASDTLQLPVGTTLDPGGLGKGLAADIVVAELLSRGAAGALVEIGGDVRVAGAAPQSDAWAISIQPASGDEHRVVDIVEGGIATSTSRLRTWCHDGERRHHLVDPATLRPADRGVVACTVIAGSAAWAEAFTKVAFAAGADEAIEMFEQRSLAVSVSKLGGAAVTTRAWTEYAR
jgi:thiamine biosynthesis lipoprotein